VTKNKKNKLIIIIKKKRRNGIFCVHSLLNEQKKKHF
jgi:hypothetical protein